MLDQTPMGPSSSYAPLRPNGKYWEMIQGKPGVSLGLLAPLNNLALLAVKRNEFIIYFYCVIIYWMQAKLRSKSTLFLIYELSETMAIRGRKCHRKIAASYTRKHATPLGAKPLPPPFFES